MSWERLIQSPGVIFFDGANGTEYQRRGLPAGSPPEALVLSNPALVKQVHHEYLLAGSNVIETNTFGANRKRLAALELDHKIVEINQQAVNLAREAGGYVVAGSMGPLGALIEPYGEVSRDEARGVFREQAEILLRAGVDLLVIETMMSLDEALLALHAAREAGASTIGVTMTYELTREGPRSPFGEAPRVAAEALLHAGASFVGSNCGKGFDVMRAVACDMIQGADPGRILLQPNAGIPTLASGEMRYPGTPEQYCNFVRDMLHRGIRLFGGCCGTTAEHVACGVWITQQWAAP
jgi:5-methyltetrahydrofolate--homocysteine methyltransferase